MITYQEKINRIAELLCKPGPNFALTGAGISTESGIPDFRSPGTGLWEKMDPTKMATTEVLRKDPRTFYKNNFDRFFRYSSAKPNDAHSGLATLEDKGHIRGVITQNIDGLHQKAGTKSLWEVHGHLRTCSCQECGEGFAFEYLTGQYADGVNPPVCGECSGVLRPDVVLFGDPMSDDFSDALMALEGCHLLLVAGTSLTVFPVASIPAMARKLVIINKDPTPWDDSAEIVLRDSLGKVFTDLVKMLEGS